jgi:hypothetical protein
MRQLSSVASVVMLSTLVSCGGSRGDDQPDRDVQYANPVLAPADQELRLPAPLTLKEWSWDARLLFEIPDSTLVLVADASLIGGGRVVAVDAGGPHLLLYDANGEATAVFGQRGSGPGDFQRPDRLLHPSDSSLIGVWDAQLRRATYISNDLRSLGTIVSLHAHEPGSTLLQEGGLRTVLEQGTTRVALEYPDPFRTGPSIAHLVVLDPRFIPSDTLLSFHVPSVTGTRSEGERSTVTHIDNPPIFSPEAAVAVFQDGTIAFAPGGPYSLFLVSFPDAQAPQVVHVTRDWDHRPVQRRDRIAMLLDAMQEGQVGAVQGVSQAALARVVERMQRDRFATVFPALAGIVVQEPDHIWVERWGLPHEGGLWDCYHRSGRQGGSVALPPRTRLIGGSGDVMLAVTKDELGVERIVGLDLACLALEQLHAPPGVGGVFGRTEARIPFEG